MSAPNQVSSDTASNGPIPGEDAGDGCPEPDGPIGSERDETKASDRDLRPTNPKLIIILSGKRKSGKDHISTLITNHIGPERIRHLAILRIAGPIKQEFAKSNKLDFKRLLDSSEYKENYRQAMVEWSEGYRQQEGWNCFLELAIKGQRAMDKPIWILNDARRPCDVEYFENNLAFKSTKLIKLRIEASEETRMSRGWQFTEDIDDRPTECGLDHYDKWTHVINNDCDDQSEPIVASLKPLLDEIDEVLRDVDNTA